MDPIPHGGRLEAASRQYPHAPRPFIDLSTGINPQAYPFDPPPAEAWRRLPEPEHLQALEAAAAKAYRVQDPAMVVAAPGTQSLIQLLPCVVPQTDIAIPTPTYAEHEAAWRASGAQVHRAIEGRQAAVITNPNNPDGARQTPEALLALNLNLLIVDEAFADFEPPLSLAPRLPHPGLIVLRSFGKAYGLAGLRLGFALASPGAAATIRARLGPWPVSGPSIAVGTQALNDTRWRSQAATTAQAAAARLDTILIAAGAAIIGGTTLFRLASSPDAVALAEHLARSGILVRTFAYEPTWLRLGLPADEAAWERLQRAILD